MERHCRINSVKLKLANGGQIQNLDVWSCTYWLLIGCSQQQLRKIFADFFARKVF